MGFSEGPVNRRSILRFALAAGAAASFPDTVQAQTFPSKALQFIVPFPPGSGADNVARIFGKQVSALSGQPVTIVNKPGGNGIIGVQSVLSAPADGHTVFIGSASTLSVNVATLKQMPYDPLTDFAPITLLWAGPNVVIVPAGSPYETLAQLVDAAKKNPGALNYASGAMGYTMFAEWLNELAGIRTTAINYKGAGDAIGAILTRTVDYAIVDVTAATELVNAGKVRAILYTDVKRAAGLPQVPSSGDLGFPSYQAKSWIAAVVAAPTPAPVVARLHALFTAAGQSPEVVEFFRRQGGETPLTSPAELREQQIQEIARWKRLVARTGMALQ